MRCKKLDTVIEIPCLTIILIHSFSGDHGQVNTTHYKTIDIDKYMDTAKSVRHIIGFTNTFIYPFKGYLNYIYKKLKNKNPYLKVYLKKDIPESFHIKKNNRTAPILLLPDPGWTIKTKKEDIPYLQEKFYRGEHGYSNEIRDMNPAFFALGPAFKKGFRKEYIESVDLYLLMCTLIGLKPGKNDGSLDRVKDFLTDEFLKEALKKR